MIFITLMYGWFRGLEIKHSDRKSYNGTCDSELSNQQITSV